MKEIQNKACNGYYISIEFKVNIAINITKIDLRIIWVCILSEEKLHISVIFHELVKNSWIRKVRCGYQGKWPENGLIGTCHMFQNHSVAPNRPFK